jgi:xanthine permease XanP
MADHTFGAPKNLLLAGIVLALIIILNRQRNPYLRSDEAAVGRGGVGRQHIQEPRRQIARRHGNYQRSDGIDWSLLLPLMLVFMITSLETIGDITATSDVSELASGR